MTKTLVVTRGIPGSGKSTLAQQIAQENERGSPIDYVYVIPIFGTDDYWLRPDGYYDFNSARLSEAHEWNRQNVEDHMATLNYVNNIIIVDNTNTTWKEVRPFVELAKKYGYSVQIREPETSWRYDAQACFKKNTHGVPLATIEKMLARWETTESIKEKIDALYK